MRSIKVLFLSKIIAIIKINRLNRGLLYFFLKLTITLLSIIIIINDKRDKKNSINVLKITRRLLHEMFLGQ